MGWLEDECNRREAVIAVVMMFKFLLLVSFFVGRASIMVRTSGVCFWLSPVNKVLSDQSSYPRVLNK